MSSIANKKTQDSDEIDLGRIIGELIDHRKLIITISVFFTAVAIIYALFATPVYQADSLIQIEQKQGNVLLNDLSQMLPDSQPQSAPEIILLQSRMILGKTVDDLNLQAKVEQNYFPIFGQGWARLSGEKPAKINVSRLYIDSIDGKTPKLTLTVVDNRNFKVEIEGGNTIINGKVGTLLNDKGISLLVDNIDAKVGDSFTITYLTRLNAISDLQKIFTVTDQGKGSGILNLTLTGEDQSRTTDLLRSISANYLSQNIARQAAQDEKSLEFLNKQLPQVRMELDQAEDKLNAYRQQKDSVDLTMEAKSVLDQIVNVDNQLNGLTFREAEISQLYTKEHPTYKALAEKRSTLLQERAKLNKRVSSMPATQQEVLRLGRDVESGRAVYMQLLNRQQELSIAKSSAIGYVRIIDDAVTDPNPIKPKKTLIVIIGLFLGVLTSVGMVILRVFLRRGIESPEQLEEIGINVYASVPVSESLAKMKAKGRKFQHEDKSLLALDNPADLAIEAIRGLRTSLHFAMMEARNNVLMISGASPNVGKTFISTNLSAIISQAGKKILLIDADMRKGYVHKLFNANNNKGLSDVLSGKAEVQDSVQRIAIAGFDFISRGIVPPNPAELLMHKNFAELINWASANYDLVIIDTPPVLAVTDAAIIGRYVGTTLLVARFEENTAKEIDVSIKRFEQSGVAVKGCILNGVVKKASSYYGYGYNHYGYSYSDEKK
ncbi:polysaccharide biosynthesis tyrosine autokinase [Klebsiella sp. CN_Kp114]|uniref:polysaccharide biosynthesis tyrosine autokinase n=1 Tax=Klebsiella TaxID=570 RepID=UPI001CC90288|nr:polysaccharide biosynthesis tyrosine autokinase [Klebsiella michiganensis]MBZ7462149.1 polysaccharide biosynthesis tyrosine autokinase [Klebsiella michiganensis]HBM2917658.1 polysaccharide biosynthesis tyrosine autokinase [Klebsiella michiganensis]